MDGPTRVTAFKPRYAVRERGKRRAAGLAETESRILGAARKLLCEEGFYGMALLRVAEEAGVARSTLLCHYKSKRDLLRAILVDASLRAGIDSLRRVWDVQHAAVAIEAAVREQCQFWTADHLVFRRVVALEVVDPDAYEVVLGWDSERRTAISQLARRLDRQGDLRPGCTVREAELTLLLVTDFSAFDHFFSAGLDPEDVERILLDLGMRVISGEGLSMQSGGRSKPAPVQWLI